MNSVEKEIYTSMLAKLVANNVLTSSFADQMGTVTDHKKHGYKVKRHITELVSLLSLFEAINAPPPPPPPPKPAKAKQTKDFKH